MARKVDQLRAEVARAQKLAGAKISRTLKNTGANVAGSQFDPRRDASKVSRYNSKQLSSYLSELNNFRDRNLQFVSGARGAPIPAHVARRFESVQETYNRAARRDLESVADVKLPGGSTIGQRERDFNPEGRRSAARSYNRPRGIVDFDVSGVTDVRALGKLEESLRKRMAYSHTRTSIAAQRFQMAEMMDKLGESEMMDEFQNLSDEQFSMLWNYTDFADTLSAHYEAVKNMSVAEEARTSDNFRSELSEIHSWASKAKIKS